MTSFLMRLPVSPPSVPPKEGYCKGKGFSVGFLDFFDTQMKTDAADYADFKNPCNPLCRVFFFEILHSSTSTPKIQSSVCLVAGYANAKPATTGYGFRCFLT